MPTNSVLYICSGVPWASNYQHIRLFSNPTEQLQNILSLKKYGPFSDFSFIREEENTVIRVPFNSEELKDCNYIVFQNPAFDSDYIFAFIKSIVYKGQNSSWIYFEVDKFQTWFLKCNIQPSFVEREHTNNDTIGANTLPENVELGPYITTAQTSLKATNLSIYILSTDANSKPFWNDPAIVGGFPVPVYWVSLGTISDFSVSVMKTILDDYGAAGKAEAIVGVFTAPTNMVSTQAGIREQTLSCAPRTLSYTPKNNKLYTYPYCALALSALGHGEILRYELFSANATLKIRGGFGANMQVSAIPQNYQGETESISYTLSIKDWPACAWVTNYYQNWLAQNKASLIINTATAATQTIAGGATAYASGGLAGGDMVLSGVTQIAGTIAEVYQHSILPDKMSGSANAADINAVSGISGFYTYCKSIRPEYAKVIDDYFTMFGYKTNRLKQPNITGRAAFNYVKTIGANVTGKAPNEILSFIANMLDRGITFWHTNDVGNYSLKNSIV